MAFSFAGKLVINATSNRQSNPIQRPIGSRECPNWANKLVFTSPYGRKENIHTTRDINRMTVPAFFMNEIERCQTSNPIVLAFGMWYNGISRMKAERCPLKRILFNSAPLPTRTARENSTKPHETQMAYFPKNTGAMNATTAIRAVQGTSGAIRMVSSRAGQASITLVPMIAGTLHPKPMTIGIKERP